MVSARTNFGWSRGCLEEELGEVISLPDEASTIRQPLGCLDLRLTTSRARVDTAIRRWIAAAMTAAGLASRVNERVRVNAASIIDSPFGVQSSTVNL